MPSGDGTGDTKPTVMSKPEKPPQKQLANLTIAATNTTGCTPDAPSYAPSVSEVTASAATLSWYGSSYDGGSQVTGYNIEARKLPEDIWTTLVKGCHSTSYKTQNLECGSQYQFRVRAVNIHGTSDPTKPSEPVTVQEQAKQKTKDDTDDYDEKFPPFELKNVSIEPGDTFNEEYDIQEELGRGRFGVVYKVKHRKSGQSRAAKVIKCIKATEKQGVRDEIALMNSLRHPRLLQIAGAFERKRDIVVVLELISGGELFDRVVAEDFDLTEKDCILFMRQICEGLQYMHDNKILHLDLKPENILCVHKNSNYIKLIDFGLSRRFDPEKTMRVMFGTPEFIAPEVINYDPISFTSDMWSVGVVCYVLLTGLSPFMGDSDAETLVNITNGDYDFDDESFDDISQDAKDFITALLMKKKEDRLTAAECLKHKWLNQKEECTKKVVLSTDKLKKFILKRKWQKTGTAIRALGRIASLTSCTTPPGSPTPFNYPAVTSPPSSPAIPSASSTPPSLSSAS